MHHLNAKDLEILASKTAADNGFDVCGVSLLTNQKPVTMRIQVCRTEGGDVSLDDCAGLSGPIGEAIDKSQQFDMPYILEISSPGISQELKSDRDFQSFKGFPVEAFFKDDQGTELSEKGLLHERSAEDLHLNIKGRISRIPRKHLIRVDLTSPTG